MTEVSSIKKKPSVLIAGCGDTGNRLGRLLLDMGFNVWGLRRNIQRLARGISPVKADLLNPETFGQWPDQPLDYLVYCASATEHTEQGYQNAYIKGLQNTLTKIKTRSGTLKRLFFTSSTGVYHQASGEWVDENSPTSPSGITGQIMLEAEKLCQSEASQSTIIRFGGIYGPGRNYLLNHAKEGKSYPLTPIIYGNRIHVDDCAGLIAFLVAENNKDTPLKTCYLGTDGHPVPLSDVTTWLATQLDVEITSYTLKSGRGSKRCSNQRIIEQGYQFIYPDYKAGYRTILNQIRKSDN